MKNTQLAFLLLVFVAAATLAAHGQTQVFVPGNTNGGFGNPIDSAVPMVPAIAVTGPATITVTYVSGTVTDSGGVNTGPNGVRFKNSNGEFQTPLEESRGVGRTKWENNLDGLVGVFVPATRVNRPGFAAVDGTKNITPVGIMPWPIVLIGTGKVFSVTEAGTLYLGINDCWVGDNGGGFNVTVSAQ